MHKEERLSIYLERLISATPVASFEEAWALVVSTLNAVEDEFSGVPYDPSQWRSDGRLYPPDFDFEQVCDIEGVRLFFSKGHQVFIADNGAIKIMPRKFASQPLIDKPGNDGERCP
jgi:hypothetical protein